MKCKKQSLKKVMALFLSVLIFTTFLNVTNSSVLAAKSDIQQGDTFNTLWFKKDYFRKWFDGNSNRSINPSSPGYKDDAFHLDVLQNGDWQYLYRWGGDGSGRLDINSAGFKYLLENNPYINYCISVTKPVDLYLQTYKLSGDKKVSDTRQFINLNKRLNVGENTGSIDLSKIQDVLNELNTDGKLWLEGISFKMNGFESCVDTITVKSLNFSVSGDKELAPLPVESWQLNATNENFWSWDWNFATGVMPVRVENQYEENGDIVVKFNGDFKDLKYLGEKLDLDLTKTPYLNVKINSEFSYKLSVLVTDSTEGNSGVVVEEKVDAGLFEKAIDIKKCISQYVSNDRIKVFGFRIEPLENPNWKKMTISTMDFSDDDKATTLVRPEKPLVTLNTKEFTSEVLVSVNAPEDALRVQYKLGASGTWKNYSESFKVTKNIQVFARYVTKDNDWSLFTAYQISNIKKEQTGDVEKIVPIWFNKGEEDFCWYNWDWHHNKNDEDRFFITYPDEIWTMEVGKYWCTRVETQHNDSKYHLKINLNAHTDVYYKLNSDFDVNVSLKIYDRGSYQQVKIGSLSKGKSSGSFDISSIPELLALSDEDDNITVSGMVFEFSASVGQKLQVERFLFDTSDVYYEGYEGEEQSVKEIKPEWFTRNNIDNYLANGLLVNGTKQFGEVSINNDNDWQFKSNTDQDIEISSVSNSVRTNLKLANTLIYKIRSDFEGELQLEFKFKGKSYFIPVAEIKKGQQFDRVDLSTIKELEEINNYGNITVAGFKIVTKNLKVDDTIKIDLFVFNKLSAKYDDYFDYEELEKDKAIAKSVDEFIMSIQNVTLDSKPVLDEAMDKYNSLTTNQKMYVTQYGSLLSLYNEYRELFINSILSTTVTIPEKEIIDNIDEYENSTIKILLNCGDVISNELLAAAKNVNADIWIEISSNNDKKLIYSILIKSMDIVDNENGFDSKIYKLDKNIEQFKDKPNYMFALNEKNNMLSTMYLGLESVDSFIKTDEKAYAYSVNKSDNNVSLINSGEKQIKFVVENDKDYLLTTNTDVKTDNVIPQTSDNTRNMLIFIQLFCISGLVFTSLVYFKKRGDLK